MFQKDNRSKTMRWNPVMIRYFLSICQVYYLIVFNSIVTARLEQITFWKLVLNLIDAFFLPRSFSVNDSFLVIRPHYDSSISFSPPLTLYSIFLHYANFFSKVLCFMDTYEYIWKDKAFNFHSLFFEST